MLTAADPLGDRRLQFRTRSHGAGFASARAGDGHAGQQEDLRFWPRQFGVHRVLDSVVNPTPSARAFDLLPMLAFDGSGGSTAGGKSMSHLIWYILIGLISGVIAKSVMHVHMTIFWTIVLGIIGSIIGGAVTHLLSRPANERYHPAGLVFSILGAILVLFVCFKLNIHFPQVNPF